MELSGAQEEQLQSALLSAFPTRFAVEQLMRYGLDQNLNTLAGDVALSEVTFRVIEWAKATGNLPARIAKARQQNPDNPALKAFEAQVPVVASDPVVVAPDPETRIE